MAKWAWKDSSRNKLDMLEKFIQNKLNNINLNSYSGKDLHKAYSEILFYVQDLKED